MELVVRTIIALTIASLLVLAACGTDSASSEPAAESDTATDAPLLPPPAPAEDGGYPEEGIEEFMEGCVDQAGEDICVCAIDVLQAEISFEELSLMFDEMQESGTLPPELLTAVIENCV